MAKNQVQAQSQNQAKSTQSSLLISEIKDGVVVLRDGSLRAVILASAINFDLMSRQEQDAVEFSYQGFLNSLHFPVQIVIRSQRIDLDAYIENLTKLRANQDNELLGILMDDYITNIKALVEEANIMDKQFYVVVPFFPPVVSKSSFLSDLASIFKSKEVVTVGEGEFQQYKTELGQRVQLVASGLAQMGIRAIPLNTQELVELYYTVYNPDVAVNQKLIDARQMQTASVTRGPRPGETEATPPRPRVETAAESAQPAPITQPEPAATQPQPAPPPPPTPPVTPKPTAPPNSTPPPPAPSPAQTPPSPQPGQRTPPTPSSETTQKPLPPSASSQGPTSPPKSDQPGGTK